MHPSFRTQDWGWAMKFCDIHVIHTSQLKRVGELKPKAFFLHGTPEACLENDMQPKVELKSYESAVGYIGKCEATIVTSERAKFLWQPYDYTGERIHRVNKGVDLEWWQRTPTKQNLPGEPSVLYGEIWRGIKHPLHTIFAVNEIYKENPEIRLNVWGCNIKRSFWAKIFEEGQFDRFLGPRGIKTIIDYPEHYYSRGDVLVSPGLYGDVSRVQQEALGCGCPVIGWDSDPWGDTHPYKYVRSYDCKDLAAKILEVWNEVQDDPEGVQKRCREMAERYFDVNVEARQVVEVLRKVVSSI
jgi:glycosyltransferase involved in cell wall biosynthesis